MDAILRKLYLTILTHASWRFVNKTAPEHNSLVILRYSDLKNCFQLLIKMIVYLSSFIPLGVVDTACGHLQV